MNPDSGYPVPVSYIVRMIWSKGNLLSTGFAHRHSCCIDSFWERKGGSGGHCLVEPPLTSNTPRR
jgi:hypothetical protein